MSKKFEVTVEEELAYYCTLRTLKFMFKLASTVGCSLTVTL